MINTSTFDDLLILYVYDELEEGRKQKVEKIILDDEKSLNSFVRFDSIAGEVEKTKPNMSERSIESILSYSRKINAH